MTLTTICQLGLLVFWGCEGYLKKRLCIWDQSAANISEAAALKSHDLHECGSRKWVKRPHISLSFHQQLVVTTSRWTTLVFSRTKRDYYMTKIMMIHFLCPLLLLMAHKYKYYQILWIQNLSWSAPHCICAWFRHAIYICIIFLYILLESGYMSKISLLTKTDAQLDQQILPVRKRLPPAKCDIRNSSMFSSFIIYFLFFSLYKIYL